MAHLKEIIRRLEEEYGINVYGSYRGQMEINGVLFLREHSYLREELVPNVLEMVFNNEWFVVQELEQEDAEGREQAEGKGR